MKASWSILGYSISAWEPDRIGEAYRKRFNWNEGRRLPDESRMVHLACDSALGDTSLAKNRVIGERTGIVLASLFGGLQSYERFRDSLARPDDRQPMAFSFALPAIPASVLSLYYGITGPVLGLASPTKSIAGNLSESAIAFLSAGLCDQVIVGSWYYPSNTALLCGGERQAKVALAVLAATPERDGGIDGSTPTESLAALLSLRDPNITPALTASEPAELDV